MKTTRLVLDNPIAGYVGLLFVLIFGGLALLQLPVQLTPEVQEPEISVTTAWRAATPEEIESEIIEPQEDALKGIPGVVQILSEAQRGSGSVRLTFNLGVSLERALIEVINRLNRVPSYPVDADEPLLSTIGENSRPIAWFIIRTAPGNERDITSYRHFLEEVVKTRFEQIEGVSLSEVRGGQDQEIRITIDPYKAAALGVLLPEAAELIGADDTSGGAHDIGKRSYSIRFKGAYNMENFADMVLDWRDDRPVRLRDVAEVSLRLEDRKNFVYANGVRSIAANAYRETGVNVIQVMQQLKAAADQLGAGPLARAGLTIEQFYDETVYIENSIELLFGNLGLGLVLAAGILWFFTRRLQAMLVVGVSIPVSLFAALIVLLLTGRTLNTISLAALAFAVGMVLDASIIAVENILRLRGSGRPLYQAALDGANEIKGALIASTTTTVAIFLPIILLEDEAGQLFADLAIGLSAAITMSLATALVLVPCLANQWLHHESVGDPLSASWDKLTVMLMRLTGTPGRRRWLVALLFTVPAVLSTMLIPSADYLPAGKRNMVFAFIQPPPGTNADTMENEMAKVLSRRLQPYLEGRSEPPLKNYFFGFFSGFSFMGMRALDPADGDQLVPLFYRLFHGFPDTRAFAQRASLFSRGNTRSVEVNLQSRDIERLLGAGFAGFNMITQLLPGARVQPKPGLELADPQLLLLPDEERIAEAGWNRRTLSLLTRAVGEGLYVGDYFDGEEKLDIIARIENWETLEELETIPLATPGAGVLPFNELVSVERAAGPNKIRRLNQRRTITLEVIPPPKISLEQALAVLQQKVEPAMYAMLPADAAVSYSGNADKLKIALSGMSGAFVLAIVILYLLISVLFRSFRDSLLIIFTLPLATIGGVIALQLTNLVTFQPLDLLTMIGFVILLGLVVNNAILLVHQARRGERAGLARTEAVRQAVRLRLRPIMMSTLTSLFGMLPLLFAFGSGSELYRGMAAVIIGGLAVSTLFTLVLLPSLLQMGSVKNAA